MILAAALALALALLPPAAPSQVVTREIQSRSFANSKIGVSPARKLVVYLPPGYDASATQRYPVIYFFPAPWDPAVSLIERARPILDRAIERGAIRPVLFVTVDMNTPLGSSWFVNSPATGNWEDFVIQELVPTIDRTFHTLPTSASRGLAGHFMGGYGAIRLGMEHPDVFGSIYALHPVGTGNGVKVLAGLPNWDLMEHARTLDDVKQDTYSTIFTTIFEAHLPNPGKPPLYIDFAAHRVDGQLVIDEKVMDRLRANFFLESLVGRYAANLKTLRGLKFDWSRNDSNFDHVFSNQALTHKLSEYGIPHEAEEYNGPTEGDVNWSPYGRATTDLLPFFDQHLVF